jgi:hypothetical protein
MPEAAAETQQSDAPPPVVDDATQPTAATETHTQGVPETCPASGECLPPAAWVKKLCDDVYQDVALYMFRNETPWQRMYLTRETDAMNASGGASVVGRIAFDEEVIVLRHRVPKDDGVQISGEGGSYDALRWNGSCVSLDASEVTHERPPKPKASRVEWRWMSDQMVAALRKDSKIDEVYLARRKECKGVSVGRVSKRCEELDHELVDVVVAYVRAGHPVPQPGHQP